MAVSWSDFMVKRGARPAYQQLADWIEKRIRDGELSEGDQIPAQRELADRTGHSPETVGKAMALLRKRGLVETSNLGSFVA